MKPSKEQEEIYKVVADTDAHLVIEAGAGSGKTTTLLGSIPHLDRSKRILLCAFNKAIADELAKRTPGYVECRTSNSLALKYCEANGVSTNPRKLSQTIDELVAGPMRHLKSVLYDSYKEVTNLVGLCKAYLIPTRNRKAFDQLIDDMNLSLSFGVDDFAYALFNQSALDKNSCDFNDQIYFAVTEDWAQPEYDVVFVDELQDLNKAQHELIKKVLKPGGRFIGVGDSKQGLYLFNGSQPDSMNVISNHFKAIRKPLATTWRCDQSIVAIANEIWGGLAARPTAEEGRIKFGELPTILSDARDGDFVIARTNSLLIQVAIHFVGLNRPFRMANKDQVKAAQKRLARWTERNGKMNSQTLTIKCLAASKSQIGENDDIMIIKALAAMNMDSTRMETALENILGARHKKGPILMTVHGSKGLETDRVFVITDNMPHEKVDPKDKYAIEQECNMAYVAVTRAKYELYLINLYSVETSIRPFKDKEIFNKFRAGRLKTKPFTPEVVVKEVEASADSLCLDEETLKLINGG